MNATKRTPQLRFPEFTGEWREIKFKDIFCRVTSKNKENNQNILTISAQHGFVSQDKFFSKIVAAKDVQGYYLLHENDYAYNKSYSKGYPVGAIKRLAQDKGVVSTLYICFSLKEPGGEAFFDQYFESGKHNREIQKIAQEGARNHGLLNISVDDFFDIKLIAPGAAEQQKIAAFLAAVDKRVALLERKVQQLEAYKRGVIQQLFSQQLRFTRPDGSHFPAWQEKRLGGIGVTYSGLSGKSGPDFGVGSPYITYVQIFQNSYIQGSFGKVSIGSNEKQNKVQEGDIFFTTSSETPDEAGYTSVLLAAPKKDTYLNSFCFGYRLKDKNTLLPEFAQYLFRSTGVRRNIVRLAQGSTRYNISKKSVMSLTIRLPLLEEQQKIAAFLSALDEKIALTRQQLDKTKQFKKGLLQRMFV